MERIRTILAPTDLSERSVEGVRYALNLAKALGAEVTAYYVVPYHGFQNRQRGEDETRPFEHASPYAESLLRRHQFALAHFLSTHFADLTPRVTIREKVEPGVPDKKIVDWAKKEASDLIVISSHRIASVAEKAGQSVAEKVIRNAPCPVLFIRRVPDKEVVNEIGVNP
ncbi:MAG: universal stress protein [Deltaproteobacteria bacterium]|nr:universal stress protein [Deltaproteobacteria bacterium]